MGKICYVSSVICEFKGEFIRTLEKIEEKVNKEKLYDGVVYVFPKAAKGLGYMNDFEKNHIVYFIENPPKSNAKKLCLYIRNLIIGASKKEKKELQMIIEKENISVIHSHYETYDFLCYQSAKKNKIPCYVHYHDALIDSYKMINNYAKRKIKLFLLKRKYKKINKYAPLIAVSEYTYNQLKDFVSSNNIYLIRNCIDFNYILKRKNFNDKIINFGSIVTRVPKGLITILESAKIIDKSINYKLLLICSQETKHIIFDNYKDLLEDNKIEILNPVDDMNKFFEKIDCYISASFFETFSFGIAEALGYGVPCIISDIPSTKWAMQTNNCIEFQTKNSESLSNSITKMINNGCEKEKCIYAMKYMREKYSVDILTDEILKLYKGGEK